VRKYLILILAGQTADSGPCHVSGIPLQKGKNPFCKGEKRRCLALKGRTLLGMTRAIVLNHRQNVQNLEKALVHLLKIRNCWIEMLARSKL
jgi:hypothetical protein